MDIKANPVKYTNVESDYEMFDKIPEMLEEDFEISKEYLFKKAQIGGESDRLNYEKIKQDPSRYQIIEAENSFEIKIPCIYKDYPVDIIVKVFIKEIDDGVLYDIIKFDFSYTSNMYLVEVASTTPKIEIDENIESITDEGVPIPKGFRYVEGFKDDGLVIEDLATGTQFVWVPVTTNPQFRVTVNAVEDEIKTVQILNTEGLDETFKVNGMSFNKTYDLTKNVAFEVIVTYASGKVEDKIHCVDQAYGLQNSAIKILEASIEYGIEEYATMEQCIDEMLNESDAEYKTRIEMLTHLYGLSDYTEGTPIEKESVMKYGGFYIGRYEQNSGDISYEAAVAEIENRYNQYKDYIGVKVTLPSGAAWDRIAVWLSETSKTKWKVYLDANSWADFPEKDGETLKNYYANRIYKLLGNYEEWTTSIKDGKNVLRGGSKEAGKYSLLSMLSWSASDTATYKGYRMLLYINE